MFKKVGSRVAVVPNNSVSEAKQALFDRFSEMVGLPVTVYNRGFGDIELISESKIKKDGRISICNGFVCNTELEIGVKRDIDIVTIKDIDISPPDPCGYSDKTNVISGTFKFVKYFGYGHPVMDMVGNVMAEVTVDNNVFLLLDAMSDGVGDNVLEYVLNEACGHITGKTIDGNPFVCSKQSFLYGCSVKKKADEKIKTIMDSIKKADEKATLMQERLITFLRYINRAREIIRDEYKFVNTINESVMKDLEDLKKLDGYKMIRVLNDSIFGITKEIIIESGGKKFKLGSYRIEISMETSKVRIYNVGTNLHNGSQNVQHPHVRDNQACLGNIQTSIHEYIGKYEFSVVFDLLYQLLSNYNQSSPFSQINNWPEL